MNFSSNGRFNYYAGIGNGGKGNYRIGSRNIAYRVTCYEDNSLEKGTLFVSKKYGLHLIMKYDIYIRFTGKRNKNMLESVMY